MHNILTCFTLKPKIQNRPFSCKQQSLFVPILVTKVSWEVLEYVILKIQCSRLENGAWDQDGAKSYEKCHVALPMNETLIRAYWKLITGESALIGLLLELESSGQMSPFPEGKTPLPDGTGHTTAFERLANTFVQKRASEKQEAVWLL